MWLNLLLNIGMYALNLYTKNTSSQLDDKVLDIVKDGAVYLSKKTNNNITKEIANQISKREMTFYQKGK